MTNPSRDGASMSERVPAEVELRAIGLSFSVPAGKNLSQTWQRELRTESESRASIRVSRERLALGFSPAILIDALWPAMNMELGGATLDFATGRITATVGSIHGVTEGLVDFSENANKEICALISAGFSGTAMAQPGYDPLTDTQIVSTLEAIADNFRRQPSSGRSEVDASDFGSPRLDIKIATSTPFSFIEDNAGLSVAQGTVIEVSIGGQGNLASIVASRSTGDRVRAAKIETVTITSNGIVVVVSDKPVAYLDRMRIDRGGVVTLEKMRLAGTAGEAEGMESLFRVIATALIWTQTGASLDAALAAAANSSGAQANIVPGLVRGKIESTLTEGVRQIIRAHKQAIPEVDLEEVFVA